jgi:phage internal scaffolding protein
MAKKFQTAYGTRVKPKIKTGKGLTEQAHKEECDINYILRDYARTGFIKHAKEHEGKYDDFSVQDFQEAMFIVAQANSMFEELPGQVRKEFNNDPKQFLGFVQNPDNKERMEKMGILRGNDGIDMHGVATNAPIDAGESQNLASTETSPTGEVKPA